MNSFIKSILILTVAAFSATALNAQVMDINNKQQKVVFQLSNNDTVVHKSLVRQLNNLLKATPDIKIEVVTHGPGVEFLSGNTSFKNNIETLHQKGIAFLICRNTLTEKKIDANTLLSLGKIIPAGIAHIITRQSEGWSYIKAGF